MQIIVNGETKTVSNELTALQLLQDMGIEGQKLALEINQEVIPRSTFAEHRIQAGDAVEIIHAIGGG